MILVKRFRPNTLSHSPPTLLVQPRFHMSSDCKQSLRNLHFRQPKAKTEPINGEPPATIGCDTLVLHEDDDLVHLPTIVVSLLVVDRLDTLSTDVVVGSDVTSKQGSLHLCYDNSKVNPLNVTGLCMPGTAHIFFKIFKLVFHANLSFASFLLGLHGPYNFVVSKINF